MCGFSKLNCFGRAGSCFSFWDASTKVHWATAAEEPPLSQSVPALTPHLHQPRVGCGRQGWLQRGEKMLQQWGDAGRLCRRATSLRQQEPQLHGEYGARTLVQARPCAALGWHLAEHRSDAVTTISPLSKHQLCPGTHTRPAFRFSAVAFRTTHRHAVLFSQTTRHPWLVCSQEHKWCCLSCNKTALCT